jgi:hypothetical protein
LSASAPASCSRLHALLVLSGISLLVPRGANAQETTVRADLSASTVRYGEAMRTRAIGLTPELVTNWPRAIFRVTGGYSQLSAGGTALQGSGGVSLYTPHAGPLMAELEAVGGGSRTGSTSTSQLLAIARAHAGGAAAGAWLGGGLGTASDGFQRHPSRQGEIGGWVGRGAARAAFSIVSAIVDDTVRYTDANLSTSASAGRFEVSALAGARSGSQPELFGSPVRSWASATLTSWLTRQLAIVAGGGRYPVDLAQGFPGGTYASIGVRVGGRFSLPGNFLGSAPLAAPRPPTHPVAEGLFGFFQITTLASGRRLAFLHAPEARTVELAGDFTEWRPLALTSRPDGWWSIELDLRAGRYEIAIRADGGAWQAPPGLISIRDEFGGQVGVLDVQ